MKLRRFLFLSTVAAIAAGVTYPYAMELLAPSSPPAHRVGTEVIPLAIAFATWFILFGATLSLLLRVRAFLRPAATATIFLFAAAGLLTIGQAALLVPLNTLHFACVTAHLCQVSALMDDIYTTFSILAYRSPLQELLFAVPEIAFAALALRHNPSPSRSAGTT